MFICDISTVGATVHAWHLALHMGLATIVSLGGVSFLGLGFRAHRRTMRRLAEDPRSQIENPGTGREP